MGGDFELSTIGRLETLQEVFENVLCRKIGKPFYFLLIIMAIALLGSCANHESSKKLITSEELVPQDLNYVVSLSRSREPVAKLLFFKENGEQYRELDYRGSSIHSLNYFHHTFFMHSNRTNKHYRLNDSDGFEAFSLTSTKSEFRDSPTWFAISDETGLIETMNYGRKKGGDYLSGVIYDYDGEKREVLLKWEYLNGGISTKDQIFIESYNDERKRNGIG